MRRPTANPSDLWYWLLNAADGITLVFDEWLGVEACRDLDRCDLPHGHRGPHKDRAFMSPFRGYGA